jgi:hypothetical protein
MSEQQTLSGATVKLGCWRPQGIPLDEPERAAYRQLAVEAVFSICNNEHRPAQLSEICHIIRKKIREKLDNNDWSFTPYRSKRTIDRRVNEAASLQFNPNGTPKIVAVTSGIYQPNPQLFKEKMKTCQ